MIPVAPDTTVRVANSESAALKLDVDASADGATITPRFGDPSTVSVVGNELSMPLLESPNMARIDWTVGGVKAFTTYAEVVSRHYFKLDDLRAYGDGQDDFADMPEAALFRARQAATEVFEQNARRSFVHRIGRTKDYGRGTLVNLEHCDVIELLTDGYRLVSDSQVVVDGPTIDPYPIFVEYEYGADDLPEQVSRAVLELAAYMLRPSNRPVGATGESSDAGYIHFTTAGRDGATDIPEVNAAIQQFGREAQCVW